MGLNCYLGPHERFIRNSHKSYNRVIHLLSGCKVSSFGYLLFSTLPRINDNVYFGILVHDPVGPFERFRGNNSSKQRQIELKF